MRAAQFIIGAILAATPFLLLAYNAGGFPAIAATLVVTLGFGSVVAGIKLMVDP